jgi:hypothetical protein
MDSSFFLPSSFQKRVVFEFELGGVGLGGCRRLLRILAYSERGGLRTIVSCLLPLSRISSASGWVLFAVCAVCQVFCFESISFILSGLSSNRFYSSLNYLASFASFVSFASLGSLTFSAGVANLPFFHPF